MSRLFTLSLITALALSVNTGSSMAGSDSSNTGGKAATPAQGIRLPVMNPANGRKLFASKGCVVCHSINGVGGEDAPKLDAKTMPEVMNPFDFAARMWRGAVPMITMQEDELGGQIEFNGDELADIIAFVHNPEEQKKFSQADIPANISKLMSHLESEDEEHEMKEHDGSGGMMMRNKANP